SLIIFPLFFFFIIRPPPSSTLFPYTTLFRSGVQRAEVDRPAGRREWLRVAVGEDEGCLCVRHKLPPKLECGLGGRGRGRAGQEEDRKSTRLNSSHVAISYAVFCLKKKKKE